MASVYISEYSNLKNSKVRDLIQAAEEPGLAIQKVTASGTSGQSSAFNAETRFVRIHTDAIVSIKFGSNPTATTSDLRLQADATEYFGVTPGHKVAVITNT